MSLTDEILTPYAISFAINSSCEIHSKGFERSVSNAAKTVSYQKIQKVGYTSIFQELLTSLINMLIAVIGL